MNRIQALGCDPEVFLFSAGTNKYISSVGLIGGSKDYPMPIDDHGNAVQEDNVTVEFNTPPCKTVEDFKAHINRNKNWIQRRAADLGLQLMIKPSAVFERDQLQSHEAQTFGCEPDFNAWLDGKRNPRPNAKNKNLRSCGGHVHIQVDHNEVDILEVIKAMDLFVGCLMLEFDEDKGRRELYGKAGAFRKKSYGVEYRTASNAWIESDDRIQWVWDQTEKALEFVASGRKFTAEEGKMIQDCINNSDVDLLEQLKKEFNNVL
jgi:Phage phiEco32-like COOH.NH2 ligase-type 2